MYTSLSPPLLSYHPALSLSLSSPSLPLSLSLSSLFLFPL